MAGGRGATGAPRRDARARQHRGRRGQAGAPGPLQRLPAAGGSEEDEGHGIHLPQPSYWPFVASLGIFIAAYGIVFNDLIVPWGIAILGTFIGFYAKWIVLSELINFLAFHKKTCFS